MMRRFAVLVVGVVALSVGAWYVNDEYVEPEPLPRPTATMTPPPPSQADRLMAFCDKAANRANALCKVDPNDPEAVKDAVERIVEQASPRIIERDSDDDDDDNPPDVNVVVPRSESSTQQPQPTSEPTPAPPQLPIEIPQIPAMPVEVPDIPLPLLP
jgi:hypothetical protein